MLRICKDAGFGQELVLSADVPTPSDSSLLMAVATDDIMLFSSAGPGVTQAAAEKVEEALMRS